MARWLPRTRPSRDACTFAPSLRPQREGAHIHTHLEMRLAEALLGRTVSVPTIDGIAALPVPPFTQNGDVLRMRGKGVQDPRGRGRGDQLVHVR